MLDTQEILSQGKDEPVLQEPTAIYGYALERSYQFSQGSWGPAVGEPDDR